MPRFYEEAAHLLLLMMARGIVFAPGSDHAKLLKSIAAMLDCCVRDRPTHADAANTFLSLASAHGMRAIDSRESARMIALAGTMIGNLMTMHRHR